MPNLHRYWIKFDIDMSNSYPGGTLLGVGVTAFSRSDALELVRQRVSQGEALPSIAEVREDIDISTIDPRHVLPNIGKHFARGVWFPIGYE